MHSVSVAHSAKFPELESRYLPRILSTTSCSNLPMSVQPDLISVEDTLAPHCTPKRKVRFLACWNCRFFERGFRPKAFHIRCDQYKFSQFLLVLATIILCYSDALAPGYFSSLQ